VQADRLQLVEGGHGEKSWSIGYGVIPGRDELPSPTTSRPATSESKPMDGELTVALLWDATPLASTFDGSCRSALVQRDMAEPP